MVLLFYIFFVTSRVPGTIQDTIYTIQHQWEGTPRENNQGLGISGVWRGSSDHRGVWDSLPRCLVGGGLVDWDQVFVLCTI